MPWEGDYRRLVGLLESVAKEYARRNPARKRFALDFEYKRVQPGRLELKQVRPLPLADERAPATTTFLMPSVETFVVEEGEYSSVFAKHRLKCQLRLVTEARRLTAVGLGTPPFTAAAWDASHLGAGWILTNAMTTWPGFAHALSADQTRDAWVVGSGGQRRTLGCNRLGRISSVPPRSNQTRRHR
jgi:hypothetical protein